MEEAYSITDTLAGIVELSPHVFYDIKLVLEYYLLLILRDFTDISHRRRLILLDWEIEIRTKR